MHKCLGFDLEDYKRKLLVPCLLCIFFYVIIIVVVVVYFYYFLFTLVHIFQRSRLEDRRRDQSPDFGNRNRNNRKRRRRSSRSRSPQRRDNRSGSSNRNVRENEKKSVLERLGKFQDGKRSQNQEQPANKRRRNDKDKNSG